MAGRYALILANWIYEDSRLKRLVTPEQDATGLADALRDPNIGAFDNVKVCENYARDRVEEELELFFLDKRPDDLLLVYFSGHGVRDAEGYLYLAVRNTKTRVEGVLTSTAVSAQQITKFLDSCRSRSQVLVLDCCHSGAFSQGIKAAIGSVGTKDAFAGNGYGRWVLTATDATQYAWEGDKISGNHTHSIFTRYLIEGLRTGNADVNDDGRITVEELYQYVHARVQESGAKQTPHKWSYKQQGDVLIARRVNNKTALIVKKRITWKIAGLVGASAIIGLVWLSVSVGSNRSASRSSAFSSGYAPEAPPLLNRAEVVSEPQANNDGSDIDRPVLSPRDVNVTDKRQGREWSQRCEDHLNTGKLGWARAACNRGLSMSDIPGRVRGSLLYNLGRAYRAAQDTSSAKQYFRRALNVDDITNNQRNIFSEELESLP